MVCSHIAHTVWLSGGLCAELIGLVLFKINYFGLDQTRSDRSKRVRFPLALPSSYFSIQSLAGNSSGRAQTYATSAPSQDFRAFLSNGDRLLNTSDAGYPY